MREITVEEYFEHLSRRESGESYFTKPLDELNFDVTRRNCGSYQANQKAKRMGYAARRLVRAYKDGQLFCGKDALSVMNDKYHDPHRFSNIYKRFIGPYLQELGYNMIPVKTKGNGNTKYYKLERRK